MIKFTRFPCELCPLFRGEGIAAAAGPPTLLMAARRGLPRLDRIRFPPSVLAASLPTDGSACPDTAFVPNCLKK